ncbi:TPA: hypothetical protein ACXJLS_000404 [Stenotrophomonas maltophilia]
MSGRFYDPNPVYFDLLSNQPVAGGFLQFYEIGTTTPKLTWSDPGLTIPNANPVPLDSSGRANVNIWLSGSYSVRLTNSLGAVIWTRDVSDGSSSGTTIPPLEAGKFLTTDGSVLLFAEILQLPDPTGSDGKVPVASGGVYVLQSFPTYPTVPVVTDNSVKTGTILQQWGTGTIPATGTKISSVVITFPTAYVTPPYCTVGINRGSGVVAAGFIGVLGWTSSTTQLTIYWDLNIVENTSEYRLMSPFPVAWSAIGKVAS